MRLVCPNCKAQYEVANDAIPEDGRDVQCANCDQAWFQHADGRTGPPVGDDAPHDASPAEAAKADEAALEAAAAVENTPPPAEEVKDQPEPAPETEGTEPETAAPEDTGAEALETNDADSKGAETKDAKAEEAKAEDTGTDEAPIAADETAADENVPPSDKDASDDQDNENDDDTPASDLPEFKRRPVDEGVIKILREEAEREARAREAEALETQPDLGLAVAATVSASKAAEEAEAKQVEEAGPQQADEVEKRSDRLPNVDQINSTLRATSDRQGDAAAVGAPETVERKTSSFRRGFVMMLTVAIVLLALYVAAPAISARFPSVEPVLTAYAEQIDAFRLWLDGRMQDVISSQDN